MLHFDYGQHCNACKAKLRALCVRACVRAYVCVCVCVFAMLLLLSEPGEYYACYILLPTLSLSALSLAEFLSSASLRYVACVCVCVCVCYCSFVTHNLAAADLHVTHVHVLCVCVCVGSGCACAWVCTSISQLILLNVPAVLKASEGFVSHLHRFVYVYVCVCACTPSQSAVLCSCVCVWMCLCVCVNACIVIFTQFACSPVRLKLLRPTPCWVHPCVYVSLYVYTYI